MSADGPRWRSAVGWPAARNHQVIVVTHLPQVAAFADHHVVIGKDDGGRTSTVRTLQRDERVGELARMLAGLGTPTPGAPMPRNCSQRPKPTVPDEYGDMSVR